MQQLSSREAEPAEAVEPVKPRGPWSAIYDRMAAGYDVIMTSSGWHRHVDKHSLVDVPPCRILDVGCGTGRLLGRAQERGFDVYGIDPAEGMVLEARKLYGLSSDRVRVAGADRIPFDDGQFDLVTACGAMLHVEDMAPAAREMLRVTRPGGLVRILDYTQPPIRGLYSRMVGLWAHTVGYYVHDYPRFFTEDCDLEANVSVGRGGYLHRFDFRRSE